MMSSDKALPSEVHRVPGLGRSPTPALPRALQLSSKRQRLALLLADTPSLLSCSKSNVGSDASLTVNWTTGQPYVRIVISNPILC